MTRIGAAAIVAALATAGEAVAQERGPGWDRLSGAEGARVSEGPARGGGVGGGAPDDESEPDDGAAAALAAGAGVIGASLGVGGTMIGRGRSELTKNAGLLGAQSGMILAPVVSHAIVGETMRGIWFSLPLFVPLGVNSTLTALYPSIIKRAAAGIQYMTFISFTLSMFGAGIGVLDAARVSERRPKAKTSPVVSVAPIFGAGVAGAAVSGSL